MFIVNTQYSENHLCIFIIYNGLALGLQLIKSFSESEEQFCLYIINAA